jgi:3,4-dihydroxy 2-butanone 4-phosphate synthase/GTP cyclohydrolase II
MPDSIVSSRSSETHSLKRARASVLAGKPVAIVAEDRRGRPAEHLPFLMLAADHAKEAAINELTALARGMVYLCLPSERCEELELRPTTHDQQRWKHKLRQSIDAADCIGIGISAADRAHTIAVAMDGRADSRALVSPGHVFPLSAESAGTLGRAGPTEAAVDLATIAGCRPGAVICEVLDQTGAIATISAVRRLCETHHIPVVSIDEIVQYRWATERIIVRETSANLPLPDGEFTAIGFRDRISGDHHLALARGPIRGASKVLVSVHRECRMGLAFSGCACDCRKRLDEALERIGSEGGIVIYLTLPVDSSAKQLTLASCARYGPESASAEPTDPPRPSATQLVRAVLRELGVTRASFLHQPGSP